MHNLVPYSFIETESQVMLVLVVYKELITSKTSYINKITRIVF